MVTAGDFKNGLTIEFEGNIYQIIEFQHVKPGKGAAFVRCKLKNIKSGGVVEKLSVQQRSSRMRILKEKRCSICTTMENFTTLWTMRHLTRSLSDRMSSEIL